MKAMQAARFKTGSGSLVFRSLVFRYWAWVAPLLLFGWTLPVNAEVFTLYDGTTQAKTPDLFTPTYLTFQSVFVSGAFGQSYDPAKQATHVNSTGIISATGGYAGHSNHTIAGTIVNPEFPVLDRQAGYKIGFTLEMLSESRTDNRPDRAGFSIIAVSSDVADGVNSSIEIGFQADRVFAQNDNFVGAAVENTAFNPVGPGFVDYELAVFSNTFDLTADGVSVLSGSLHDHFAPLGDGSPYRIPNFIFLGDDTTSGVAEYNLRSVSLTTVPEPSSLALLGLGLLGAAVCSVRHRRHRVSV